MIIKRILLRITFSLKSGRATSKTNLIPISLSHLVVLFSLSLTLIAESGCFFSPALRTRILCCHYPRRCPSIRKSWLSCQTHSRYNQSLQESRLSQSILKAVVEVNLSERTLTLILCMQYLSFQHDSQVVRYTKDFCAPSPTERDHRERGAVSCVSFDLFLCSQLYPQGTCWLSHHAPCKAFLISTTRQFDILTARSA